MPKAVFKPGYDPRRNVGGRPKRREVIDAMLAELKKKPDGQQGTNAVLLAQTAVRESIKGDVSWAKLLLEYVYGKPVQPVDIEARVYAEQIAAIVGAQPADILSLAERRKVS